MSGPYLKGLSAIRNVQWGAKYLWDIRFPSAPAPFSAWFPAVDIDIDMFELNFKDFELGMTTTGVPIGTSTLGLKLTFNDDVSNTIHNWLTQWVRGEILNSGLGLSSLAKSAKLVQISKLDFQRRPITTQTFWVVPVGSMVWNGTSSADVSQNSCDFKIVGVADSSIGSDASPGVFKKFGSLSGIIKGVGNLLGVDLGGLAKGVDTAINTAKDVIDVAKQGMDTYNQVKQTYESVKNTVQSTVNDAKSVVQSFKNANSLEGYLGALEQGVNVASNIETNVNNVVDTVNSGINNTVSSASALEAKFKNLF